MLIRLAALALSLAAAAPAFAAETLRLVREELFPLDYRMEPETVAFRGDEVLLATLRDVHPHGGGVYTRDLDRWRLTDAGLTHVEQKVLPLQPRAYGFRDGALLMASGREVFDLGAGTRFSTYVDGVQTADVYQVASDDRGYVLALSTYKGGSIQILRTDGLLGWEQLLARDQVVRVCQPYPTHARMGLNGRWLVVTCPSAFGGQPLRLDVYDLAAPYEPRLAHSIPLDNAVHDLGGWRPIFHGRWIIVPLKARVAAFDLATGAEVASVTPPEPVARGRAWAIAGDTLFAGGHSKLYTIDLSGLPQRLELAGWTHITRDPEAKGIAYVHATPDRTFVIFRTRLYGNDPRRGVGLVTLARE